MSCLPNVILRTRSLNGRCVKVGSLMMDFNGPTACRLNFLLYTWICVVGMLTRNAFHYMLWVVKCDGHVVGAYCAYKDM
jgi:hypothetical protein